MKMDKLKKFAPILLLIALGASLVVATLENGDLVGFVTDLTGIQEIDRQLTGTFFLENLPEFFNATVFIQGSGYINQTHFVSVEISHDRPDESLWLASGNFSIGIGIEPTLTTINSGSFTNLTNTEPYVSPSQPWKPSGPNGTYNILLSLNNLSWARGYIIEASAGTGGSITPSGSVIVVEGVFQAFNITANKGYEILDIIVDGENETTFGLYTHIYAFGLVDSNHTIEAYFASSARAEYNSGYTYVWKLAEWTVYNATYNGDANHTYLGGETINYVVNAKNAGVAFTELTYDVRVKIHDGTYVTLLTGETNTYGTLVVTQNDFTITGSFVQPSGESGYWDLLIQIIGTTP